VTRRTGARDLVGGETAFGADDHAGASRRRLAGFEHAPERRALGLPETQTKIGVLLARDAFRERSRRLDEGNHGAAALFRRLPRHALPAPRALAPLRGIEVDDRALGERGEDARDAELGGGAN